LADAAPASRAHPSPVTFDVRKPRSERSVPKRSRFNTHEGIVEAGLLIFSRSKACACLMVAIILPDREDDRLRFDRDSSSRKP